MKKILIATDFSTNARPALEYAVFLSLKAGAVLHVLHTYMPVYPLTETVAGPPVTVEWEEAYRHSAQETLDNLTEELKARGLTVVSHLELGPLSTVATDIVKQEGIDLTVLGRSESGGWLFELFGNVATQLLDNLTTPLLMVPAEVTHYKIDRMAYATQLEFDETEILAQVYDWADEAGAEVHLVHVRAAHEPNIQNDEDFIEDIRKTFPDRNTTILERDASSVVDGIEELTKDVDADILVMSTHHRNLFTQIVNPSKTRKLLLHCSVPTLVFPLEAL
jgi:nucleotide-binding universal stress UspA family protein